MGIPRFYRWLSERYPLINEAITAEQIPEFDNLYLDMNGIIHNCSHNNTGGLCVKEESDVFVEAFKYITRLFSIIRPKKLLYMAVDGCAPRAKMNQQRSRRFRAANEAREAREKAEEMGEVISGTPFDSNCITPGTEFMTKLTEHLRFFICMKIQDDPLWQEVCVVLSGPDEPGEGEHKIMDYIRASKAQPGYAANLRHCLYGLDADLIMLALASHEPHFALLREEVIFGKRMTEDVEKRTVTSKDRFQLLHLSVLREYLDLEFKPETPAPFVYRLERLIDDIILFCVLVGNDFLPNLPFAEISEGGLDDFFTVYKAHLNGATQGQSPWLTLDCGMVAFENLARFLKRYSNIEDSKLETAVEDGQYILGARRSMGPQDAAEPADPRTAGLLDQEPILNAEEARLRYYQVKFGLDCAGHAGTQQRRGLFQAYLEGLQWVMLYYFRGPYRASWSWYYPYYYAPMASDLIWYDRLARPEANFEVGRPFQPFQQLMAVLPSNSKTLLPECFHWLFDSLDSPIIDFYPKNFNIDMDGVKVPWGGVTLIPFIQEDRLLVAMEEAERRGPEQTAKEVAQNCFGQAHSFRYDAKQLTHMSSPTPDKFKDLLVCPVRSSVFKHPPLPVGMAHFPNELLPGFKPRIAGFPTLHWHPLTFSFEAGIKVFQYEARGKGIMLHLHPKGPMVRSAEELRWLMQAPCARVDYPFGHRGQVVAVYTADKVYLPGGKTVMNNPLEHENLVWQLTQEWRRKGVALEFDAGAAGGPGDVAAGRARRGGQGGEDAWQIPIAEVRMLESVYFDADGRRQYRFLPNCSYRLVPLVSVEEEEELPRPPAERFPAECKVVCVDPTSPAFGHVGRVAANKGSAALVSDVVACFDFNVTAEDEEALQRQISAIVEDQQSSLKWYTLADAAKKAQVEVHVARQVLGSLMARTPDNVREDIGMNLMCESKSDGIAFSLPCYSMKTAGVWMFSDLTVESLTDYHNNFPGLFDALQRRTPTPGQWEKDFEMKLAFPDSRNVEYASKKLIKYLTSCSFKKIRLAPGKYEALQPESIGKVYQVVERLYTKMDVSKAQFVRIRGQERLYRAEGHPTQPPARLVPKKAEDVSVGQRGIYIKTGGLVPCGSKGTIIGIYSSASGCELEILLDCDSFSASDLCGRAPPLRGVQIPLEAFMPVPLRGQIKQSNSALWWIQEPTEYVDAAQPALQSGTQQERVDPTPESGAWAEAMRAPQFDLAGERGAAQPATSSSSAPTVTERLTGKMAAKLAGFAQSRSAEVSAGGTAAPPLVPPAPQALPPPVALLQGSTGAAEVAAPANARGVDKDRRAAGSKLPCSYYAAEADVASGKSAAPASAAGPSKGSAASAAGTKGGGRGRGGKDGRYAEGPGRPQAAGTAKGGQSQAGTYYRTDGQVDWEKAFGELLNLGPRHAS